MTQCIRRIFLAAGLVAVFAGMPMSGAQSQPYPEKAIRWIIPYPPGGSNDVLGRYLGLKLTDRLGQQVVIDNRGGANGIIGADLAASISFTCPTGSAGRR